MKTLTRRGFLKSGGLAALAFLLPNSLAAGVGKNLKSNKRYPAARFIQDDGGNVVVIDCNYDGKIDRILITYKEEGVNLYLTPDLTGNFRVFQDYPKGISAWQEDVRVAPDYYQKQFDKLKKTDLSCSSLFPKNIPVR